jgi:hypothetical protein
MELTDLFWTLVIRQIFLFFKIETGSYEKDITFHNYCGDGRIRGRRSFRYDNVNLAVEISVTYN